MCLETHNYNIITDSHFTDVVEELLSLVGDVHPS